MTATMPDWILETPDPEIYSLTVTKRNSDFENELFLTREEFIDAKATAASNLAEFVTDLLEDGVRWFTLTMFANNGGSIQSIELTYAGAKAVICRLCQKHGVNGLRALLKIRESFKR